jgi:hypothetical protein
MRILRTRLFVKSVGLNISGSRMIGGDLVKPLKLKEIIDEMDMQTEEYRSYLNKETAVIISVSMEELSIAEDSEEDDDFSEYPEWQQESLKDALDVIDNEDNYIELPDKCEINEYDIMEDFCGSVNNDSVSNALYSAIKGRGAFRRFKDAIIRFGVENDWYRFREEALKKIAIEWCEDNEITFVV